MSRDSEVAICLLLPEVLGTYSDSGNAIVLAQRLRWRGIPARILTCTADQEPPTTAEIYLLGGGEDTAQLHAALWLRAHASLCDAIATRALTLAVCAGMQILGHTMTDPRGNTHRGAGLLDIVTEPRRRRATGEVVTRGPGIGLLTGFENHRGATTLGPEAVPFGQVLSGVGNGDGRWGRKSTDGAHTEHIIATYLHGPVLARNPALADHIISRAIGTPLTEIEVPDLPRLRADYLSG